MSTGYRRFFSVNFHHDFYEDNHLPGLSIAATANTLNKMRAYALILKELRSGFLVLINDSAETRQDIFDNQISLVYCFNITSPDFENLSELSYVSKRDGVYYFSDKNAGNTGGAISNGSYVNEADYIYLKPKSFSLQLPDFAGGQIDLVSYHEGNILQNMYGSNLRSIEVDLQKFAPGRYLLRSGNTVLYDFYADDELFFKKPYGIIEIFNVQTASAAEPIDFTITFRARATIWKYYVINKSSSVKGGVNITDEKENVLINSPDSPVILADGSKADVFETASPISLAQFPPASRSFKLVTKADEHETNTRILIDPLPIAGTRTIKADRADKTKVYSEIFVYI